MAKSAIIKSIQNDALVRGLRLGSFEQNRIKTLFQRKPHIGAVTEEWRHPTSISCMWNQPEKSTRILAKLDEVHT